MPAAGLDVRQRLGFAEQAETGWLVADLFAVVARDRGGFEITPVGRRGEDRPRGRPGLPTPTSSGRCQVRGSWLTGHDCQGKC